MCGMLPVRVQRAVCSICKASGVKNKGDFRLQCRLVSCLSCELYLMITADYRVDEFGNEVWPAECESVAEGKAGHGYSKKLADICKGSGCPNDFHPSCCERPGKPSYGVEWKNYLSAVEVAGGKTVLTPIAQLREKLQYLLCPECFQRIPKGHKRSDFCEGTGAQHAASPPLLRTCRTKRTDGCHFHVFGKSSALGMC